MSDKQGTTRPLKRVRKKVFTGGDAVALLEKTNSDDLDCLLKAEIEKSSTSLTSPEANDDQLVTNESDRTEDGASASTPQQFSCQTRMNTLTDHRTRSSPPDPVAVPQKKTRRSTSPKALDEGSTQQQKFQDQGSVNTQRNNCEPQSTATPVIGAVRTFYGKPRTRYNVKRHLLGQHQTQNAREDPSTITASDNASVSSVPKRVSPASLQKSVELEQGM